MRRPILATPKQRGRNEDRGSQTPVTAANNPPTVTVWPAGSSSFLASDSIEILVEAEDADGTIAKLQLFRNDFKVAERFEQVIAGRTLSFPVEFTKENGTWKIVEF
jgi:hypothetical protein